MPSHRPLNAILRSISGVFARVALAALLLAAVTVTALVLRQERTVDSAKRVTVTPAASAGGGAPGHVPRPNVVYVLTDDLTADLLRYMPTVQALQREGVTFSNYIVNDSLCCPSRASLLTGRYPHSTGVRTNNWPNGGWDVFRMRGEEQSTYATDLHKDGYRTGMFGKYLNGYEPASRHVPPGWDTWAVAGNGYQQFDYTLGVDGTVVGYGSRPRDYLTDVLARRSVRFIRASARARRPFFVELSTFAPHQPATPAPRDGERLSWLRAPRTGSWDQPVADGPSWLEGRPPLDPVQIAQMDALFRKRAQSVLAVDRMLRDVRNELRRAGVARNTYIFFNSDNGFHLGQHRLLPGKMTAFDHDVRVPLIVAGPGVPAGHTVPEITQNVDLRPTIDELAGSRPRGPVHGHSLADLIHGRPIGPWRQSALIEHQGPELDPSDPDHQPAPDGTPVTYEALRSTRGLYVESSNGEREYYDLSRDPDAMTNVYLSLSASKRQAMAERVRRLSRCESAAACFDAPPFR